MTSSNIPVPEQMICKGDIVSNWEFFREQWECYETATGLNEKAPGIRIATLKAVMGKDCLSILRHLDLSDDDRKKVTETLDALESHFRPTRNIVYERYKLNTAEQKQCESTDEYVNRLRHLASSCEYGTLLDEMIRDRLVLGCKDNASRARMFREKNLDLNKAIDTCRSSEIAMDQLKKIGAGSEPETVNYSRLKQGRRHDNAKAHKENATSKQQKAQLKPPKKSS